MIRSEKFNNKKILLVDKEPKIKNDRTWCFWEKQKGFFEEIVYKKWDSISFFSTDYSAALEIAPYQYKMIKGIDFYDYCFTEIAKHNNIEVLYAEVGESELQTTTPVFSFNGQNISVGNPVVFNSIYKPVNIEGKTIRLLQHFKGWIIETDKPAFDPDKATMMDFRVHQDHGTTFVYVLPFSSTSALVEYTLFTQNLLEPAQYDKELNSYIHSFLNIHSYKIKEEEFGVIPMTNEKFRFENGNIWQIGTAGGQTKASSGYTFQFIQKQSKQIVDQLIAGKPLSLLPATQGRFNFYDNTMLHILYHKKLPGDKVFARLFKNNKHRQVLRFLDNETSIAEEVKIFTTLPILPFLKAALKQL
jgi:lycopene beta-cyclase